MWSAADYWFAGFAIYCALLLLSLIKVVQFNTWVELTWSWIAGVLIAKAFAMSAVLLADVVGVVVIAILTLRTLRKVTRG